jgi:N-succinyldiaminopimelate aminotransferase
VAVAGGVPTFATFTNERGEWVLDRDSLRAAVTRRTRALLLMSPSMPTGAYLTRDDWEFVGDLADRHGLWVIYDAAMERILYDGRPVVHPASVPQLADRVITVGSASKELRMIGWRVGWIVAPEALVPDLSLMSMATVVVPVGIAQNAVASALELGDGDVRDATLEWQRRRDVLLAELHGLPVIRPAGGWSLLLDASPFGIGSAELAERFYREGRVAVTPMKGWGTQDAERFVRFVFSNEPSERLQGIRTRLLRICDDLRSRR